MARNCWIAILTCALSALATASEQPGTISERNRVIQEEKIEQRMALLRDDPESLYFAKSTLSLSEQEAIAVEQIRLIQELSEVPAFDYPDDAKILEHAKRILREAPDTDMAQMAHWNIHTLFLTEEDDESAFETLESYVYKYGWTEFRMDEAWDILANLAMDRNDPGLALHYIELYLERSPDSYPQLLVKAQALETLGEDETARALLQRITHESEGSVQANLAMMDLEEWPIEGLPDPLTPSYNETMHILRDTAVALEIYFLDTLSYPGTLEELIPTYLHELPYDSWGNLLHLEVVDDLCWVASGGSDGTFDGFDQRGTYDVLAGRDLILSDGVFIYGPNTDH